MPLLIQENIHRNARWALWHIEETAEELLKSGSFSRMELDELEKINHPKGRLEWLASRILVKKLACAEGLAQAEIGKDIFGKPYIIDAPLAISLSHAFPYAAAILHTQQAVGIDIEHAREQLLRIRHKFLHPEEALCAGDDVQKIGVYWAAKEALYKLYGKKGLQFQEDMRIADFQLQQEGFLEASLLTKSVKEHYNLHYRQFQGLLICYSL